MSTRIDHRKQRVETEFESSRFFRDAEAAGAANRSPAGTTVVIAYQDEETLVCARPLCKRLFHRLGAESVRVSLWPVAALENPRVFGGVANSDIFMFALRAEAPLPALIQSCVGAWEDPRTGGRRAVVALFLNSGDEPSPAIRADRDLRAFLKHSGQDYFSQVVTQPAAPPPNGPANLAEHAPNGSSPNAGLLISSVVAGAHWGIND
jgi:hypothetical protein